MLNEYHILAAEARELHRYTDGKLTKAFGRIPSLCDSVRELADIVEVLLPIVHCRKCPVHSVCEEQKYDKSCEEMLIAWAKEREAR